MAHCLLKTNRRVFGSPTRIGGLAAEGDCMQKALKLTLTALLTISVFCGCDEEPESSENNIDSDSANQARDIEGEPYGIDKVNVNWTACSLHEGEDDGRAFCALTQMPRVWGSSENDETIAVVAKRLPAKSGNAKVQLWLLHGGPGASGFHGFPSFMEHLSGLDPDLEVFTLDHRGVGSSEYLGCPDQEDPSSSFGDKVGYWEINECADYLLDKYGKKGLYSFGTTESAIDLAAYIHSTRSLETNVIVWGGSYGTYLAQRYLALFPEHADGVVLAGIAPTDMTFIEWDQNFEHGGLALLDACAKDELCRSKLGPDPAAVLRELHKKLKKRHCLESGFDSWGLKLLLASVAYYSPINALVPSIIYRADRCTEEDAKILNHIYLKLLGDVLGARPSGIAPNLAGFSYVLQMHVIVSEMWHDEKYKDVDIRSFISDFADDALFAYGGPSGIYDFEAVWPAYTDANWDNIWPDTQTPILMLQGDLDIATSEPLARSVAEHFNGPNQTYLHFPFAAHNVTEGTPIDDKEKPTHCATQIWLEFNHNPGSPVDSSCMEQILPLNFAGDAEMLDTYYGAGVTDAFENTPSENTALDPAKLRRYQRLQNKVKNEMFCLGWGKRLHL